MTAARPSLPTIGFWFNPAAPNAYPRPQALVGTWAPGVRQRVLAHLRAGRNFASYRASSFCRFACGLADRDAGHRDLTDGVWVWPEGLAHYVEVHAVQLPEAFVAHAASAASPPSRMPTARTARLDDGPWLTWARAQGACLDLAGWEVPDRDARAGILRQLGRDAEIALCRGDTRQIVLAHPDGALEIRQLTADGHAPRHLPGWHAWPIAR